ncbi:MULTISPECIES: ATP-binding protein [unclassified Arthrobacter]|uniref:ATP-binding protein n=1 Tax=unclassified Arthrobacter TaxID=235627 RepID=UPI0027E38B92|nr:ATP-binding protein [Arthrobacter sp. MAHUQ-56]
MERQQNVVFQGFTGSGKSYLGCALAKQACQHRIRAHYVRMPDLEEAWALAKDKPLGVTKFLKKYAAFTLLVIDEWLLDYPDEGMHSMLLELLERRYDTASTVSAPNTPRRTGTSDSAPGSTPMRSWTASCTTPSGSIPATTTCVNTPE